MVDTVWPFVARMLDRAIPKEPLAFFTIEDVREDLERTDTVLWVAAHNDKIIAAFVTSLVVYKSVRSIKNVRSIKAYLMAGDDLHAWAAPFFETMKRHAKKNGCTVLEGCGRRGWTKIYPGLIDTGPVRLAMAIQ